uniref:Uncharacterized protein n=1 Tax=viral metagenome TaxID=1070528 RepID=A0A6C0J0Q2_9ZZZZ
MNKKETNNNFRFYLALLLVIILIGLGLYNFTDLFKKNNMLGGAVNPIHKTLDTALLNKVTICNNMLNEII